RKVLGRDALHLVAIIGAAGSGKSSLARAGLLADLRAGKLAGSQSWPQVIFRPGATPIRSLAVAIAKLVASPDPNTVIDEMLIRDGDEHALDTAAELILERNAPAGRLVVLVDQFEEVFTLCTNEDERRQLIATLLHAAARPGGRTIVVLTMRADSYSH